MAGESEINPYAPPAADVDAPPLGPSADAFANPLFSPRQMLVAALLGSPLAGVILLQANFRAMARPRDAKRTLLFGTLAAVAFFALMFILPDRIPPLPINIAAALTFYKIADSLQGGAFTRHRAANGERQSNWLVFGISVGTAVAVVTTMFLLLLASS